MMMTNASRLDNAELTAELILLARCEREATAALIVHLAEFDARRLHEGEGYSSLFRYCMAVLHLSEDAVYNRINAMRRPDGIRPSSRVSKAARSASRR